MHVMLWYNAIAAFSPNSEVCTVKPGHSQVQGILQHSGSHLQSVRCVDANGENPTNTLLEPNVNIYTADFLSVI